MLQSNEKIIKHKVGLLNLAEELSNVSKARQIMGLSRDTFYRYRDAVEDGGVEALLERPRRSPNLKNRVDIETENVVVAYAVEYPAAACPREGGGSGPRLQRIAQTRRVRFRVRGALDLDAPRPGQLQNPPEGSGGQGRRRRHYPHRGPGPGAGKEEAGRWAWGEIETAHPGYLDSQDTFYVGTLKGVGRIYQQTYIDTYAKTAQAKLYKTKTPITAADMLNDKVLPFHEQHDLPVLRILTDRGTEYCGRADRHDYQLFLAINDIEHTRTKVKSPQTNGICERFHKIILQEFYQVAFRRKIYETIEQLQIDLDQWINYYNLTLEHAHYC